MPVLLEESWTSADAGRFLENVYPMYVHELSAFGADFYALDALGRWQPEVARNWTQPVTPAANLLETRAKADPEQPFQRGYVIRVDQRRVGFLCVALTPFRYMHADRDFLLSEMFVIHAYRGSGAAALAVTEAFARHQGAWELRALRDNTRAVMFWRRSLPKLGARNLESYEVDGEIAWRFGIARTR